MHNINNKFFKNQAINGETTFSIIGKLLKWLGLQTLEPVSIKIFEKRQINYTRPYPNGARLWD